MEHFNHSSIHAGLSDTIVWLELNYRFDENVLSYTQAEHFFNGIFIIFDKLIITMWNAHNHLKLIASEKYYE